MRHPIFKKKLVVPKVSIKQFERLRALFTIKGWPIDECYDSSTFERFYKTLELLDDDQQNLLIKLTYRFEHIPLDQYLSYMLPTLKRLRRDESNKNLIFITCTPKEDVGSVKSSMPVLYQLKGTTIIQHINMNPMCVVDNINNLQKYPISENTDIVMVDDFVGTGETSSSAVDYIHELKPELKDNSNIIMFSIVAMREGIKKLEHIGVRTYCAIERRKAISEEMDLPLRRHCYKIMNSIEDKLKNVKPDFRFGYEQSEALVCMERCPNNTFPVYWLRKNIAPYERR